MTKYSVIIPVYNTEKYLRECIGSILAYGGEEIEVIAVDDGSTDGSLAVLRSFGDPRLHVFHKENEGVFKTWKYGLRQAAGEYIVFVDSDDYIDASLFPFLNELLRERSYDVIQYGWTEIFEKKTKRCVGLSGMKEGVYEGEALEALIRGRVKLLGKGDISTLRWAKAFRAAFLKEILPFTMEEICMYEDDSITRPCLSLMKSFYYSEKDFYTHRSNVPTSLCNSLERLEGYAADCRNLIGFFAEERERFGFSEETLQAFAARYYSAVLGDAVWAKKKELANRILSDKSVVAALKQRGGVKCWLLSHRWFAAFRWMRKVKRFMTDRR